jgi:hypothetical protein
MDKTFAPDRATPALQHGGRKAEGVAPPYGRPRSQRTASEHSRCCRSGSSLPSLPAGRWAGLAFFAALREKASGEMTARRPTPPKQPLRLRRLEAAPCALARDYETNLTHRKSFTEERVALRIPGRHRQLTEPLLRFRQAQRGRAGRRAAGSLLRRSPPYGGRSLDGRSTRTRASWQRSPALPPPLVGAGPRACPDGGPRACPDVLPGQPRRVAPTGAPGMCQSRITVLCRRRLGCVDEGCARGSVA